MSLNEFRKRVSAFWKDMLCNRIQSCSPLLISLPLDAAPGLPWVFTFACWLWVFTVTFLTITTFKGHLRRSKLNSPPTENDFTAEKKKVLNMETNRKEDRRLVGAPRRGENVRACRTFCFCTVSLTILLYFSDREDNRRTGNDLCSIHCIWESGTKLA